MSPEPRTLHLIDPLASGHLACGALAASLAPNDRTLLIGPTRAARIARENGLRFDARVAALGIAELAWRGARRAAFDAAPEGFDCLRAWSPACAALATFAFPREPLAATLLSADSGSADRWSRFRRRVVQNLGLGAMFGSEAIAATWRSPGSVAATPPVAAPGTLGSLEPREATRARWGYTGDAPIIAVLADPPLPLDARRGMFLVGVLAIAGQPARAVLPPDSAGAERARRLNARQPGAWSFAVEDRPPPAWLHACDAAVALAHLPNGPQPLAAIWAVRAGIPTIVESPGCGGVVRERDDLVRVPPGRVNMTAACLLDMVERPREARRHPVAAPREEALAWRAALAATLDSALGQTATSAPAPALRSRPMPEPVRS